MSVLQKNIFEVYIHKEVLDDMIAYCEKFAPLEVMGLLLGNSFLWRGLEYTYVKRHIPCLSDSTTVSVGLSDAGVKELISTIHNMKMDDPEILIVGWYHSHPGYGCFLSKVDIETQRRIFNESFHIAVVVDPLRREVEFYKLTKDSYRTVSPCFLNKTMKNGEEFE